MSYIPKNLNTSTYTIRSASKVTYSPTLPVETRTIPIETRTIPIETRTIPIETRTIPIETRTLPIESRVDTRVRAVSPVLKGSVVHIESVPIESRVETRVNSSLIRKSNINVNVDGALTDIKRRYEEEARIVQQNYEIDYNNRVALVKTIEELEIVAEEERARAIDFENKYKAALAELENERRLRVEVDHENTVLKEELKRFEFIIRDSETTISRLQQELTHVQTENNSLKVEINRLTDLYNSKLKELEDKYINQIREMDGEINSLRTALDRQRAEFETRFRDMTNEINQLNQLRELRVVLDKQRVEYENRLVSLDRDWTGKYARLEETIREKDRRIADLDRHVSELTRHVNELENEIRRLMDYVSQLKMEFEEELRRQIVAVREEEAHRYQSALQTLETRLHQAEVDRENLSRKNQDLVRELNNKERQLQDLRHQLEGEISRLRAEVNDLRNQVNSMGIENDNLKRENENLKRELANREMTLSRLEGDLANLERELARIKELHAQEMTRLVNEHNNERRRWEETERALRARIVEFENIIRGLESDNGKLRADLERLKGNLADNLQKTLMQTFVTYETSPTFVVKSLP